MLDKPKKGGTEGGHVDPPEIFAPPRSERIDLEK